MPKPKKWGNDIGTVHWNRKHFATGFVSPKAFSKKQKEILAQVVSQASTAVSEFMSDGASKISFRWSCGNPKSGCCIIVVADKYTQIVPGKKITCNN